MLKSIGIICEYNPFHNGHLHHLEYIKKEYSDYTIILVLTGFFNQRGNLSVLSKYDKTKIALEMGIDLVVELPFVFSTQSADIFARGSIEILKYLNVEKIVFGSECNDIEMLKNIATIQNSNEYNDLVKEFVQMGFNYPTSISKALKLKGYDIKDPNDLLAISYIKAINEISANIEPICIRRTSTYHSLDTNDKIISASAIRKLLNENRRIKNFVPKNVLKYHMYNNSDNYFKFLKFKILSEINSLNKFQTVDEGIENRIIKYIYDSNNTDDLIFKIKSKRYTYNRINRMFVHILCNFTKDEANKFNKIEYIRLLGFNQNGKKYLNQIKKEIDIPIISKFSSSKSKMLNLEKRVTSIYAYIFNENNLNKQEYQDFPIIIS